MPAVLYASLSQAASLLSCLAEWAAGVRRGRTIDRTVTRSMRATVQPSRQAQQAPAPASPGNLATHEPRTSTLCAVVCVICLRGLCGGGGRGGPWMRCGLMCIDGTIFFTASYRCSGSSGLVHGCVCARADINTTIITVSARACIKMPCFALAMLMRDGDRPRAAPGAI
jgi:hypothetical protein